jgi:hypothetical protein
MVTGFPVCAAGTFLVVLGTLIVMAGLLHSTTFTWGRLTRAPHGSQTSEEFYGAPMKADPESVTAWRKSGKLDSLLVVDPARDTAYYRHPGDSAAHR